MVHCHAGCAQDDVINALKLKNLWPDLRKERMDAPAPFVPMKLGQGKGKVVATYDYTDEHGELLFQAVRYEPKDFRQRKPMPDGSWLWSIKGVRRVLYRLPELIDNIAAGKTIYIVEGEKDVEAARSIGLAATCNAMGADNGNGNKWMADFGDVFRGADVVIVPDQDDPGIKHTERVIDTLQGKAARVRVANPTTGKDLADWIAAGATEKDILAEAVDAFEVTTEQPQLKTDVTLLTASPAVVSAPAKDLFIDAYDLMLNLQPTNWLIKGFIERDSLALVYGPSNAGKSLFAIDIICHAAYGNAWNGHKVKEGPAFYIAGEGQNGLGKRFAAWHIHNRVKFDKKRIHISSKPMQTLDEDSVKEFSDWIAQRCEEIGQAPGTVTIDTLARNYGPGDENSTQDMTQFIHMLDKWVKNRFNCTVILVHHSGHTAERARGSSALRAAVDAEYEITKDDAGNVAFVCKKMKDAEFPPDLMFKIKAVELPGLLDDDGNPVYSATVELSDDAINLVITTRGDGTQVKAKEFIELLQHGWLTIKELAESIQISEKQARSAMDSLEKHGLIAFKGQGRGRKGEVTKEGMEALSLTGAKLGVKSAAPWKNSGVSKDGDD
ncbi:AAA family ATPase [Pseudomonas sp.]|uniref:AAA family ATPase n=1 Tax=Pseudomonas sp. TaxID=306 RepID=UPI00258AF4E9|nr:AAA family ATPase [Pseudomonas sp.]